jgi:hypothetical protein
MRSFLLLGIPSLCMPVALPQLHATAPPWNASMRWLLLTHCTLSAHQRGAELANGASLLFTCLVRPIMRADPTLSEACAPACQLVGLIDAAGPDVVIDIDNALCRESLQVIGARAVLSSCFGGVLLCRLSRASAPSHCQQRRSKRPCRARAARRACACCLHARRVRGRRTSPARMAKKSHPAACNPNPMLP